MEEAPQIGGRTDSWSGKNKPKQAECRQAQQGGLQKGCGGLGGLGGQLGTEIS